MAVRTATAPEAIGAYWGDDISEVKDGIYQPALLFKPSVYTDGTDYYCAPTARQKPPMVDRDGQDRGFVWKPCGFTWRGREVYVSKMSDMNAKEDA